MPRESAIQWCGKRHRQTGLWSRSVCESWCRALTSVWCQATAASGHGPPFKVSHWPWEASGNHVLWTWPGWPWPLGKQIKAAELPLSNAITPLTSYGHPRRKKGYWNWRKSNNNIIQSNSGLNYCATFSQDFRVAKKGMVCADKHVTSVEGYTMILTDQTSGYGRVSD